MCRCGHHPKAFLNTAPNLSQMTTHEMMDLLEQWGYNSCEIRDDGVGRITVITDAKLTSQQKDALEASMPPGIILLFNTKSKIKLEVPKSLEKWNLDTKKYVK